jgi:hypothetical protein
METMLDTTLAGAVRLLNFLARFSISLIRWRTQKKHPFDLWFCGTKPHPHLPVRARLPPSWTLLFTLDQHGISLHTFTHIVAPTLVACCSS